MKEQENDEDVCRAISSMLRNISPGSYLVQKAICEKGGLEILLNILEKHGDDGVIILRVFIAICSILSSQEMHSKYYTGDVSSVAKQYYEEYPNEKLITILYRALTREDDSWAKEAVSRDICTGEAYPKCEKECNDDTGLPCSGCWIQQKVYRCYTCDTDGCKVKFYCERCWKKYHQGHECEEFFCPARCATK